jgi:hypothetical protein
MPEQRSLKTGIITEVDGKLVATLCKMPSPSTILCIDVMPGSQTCYVIYMHHPDGTAELLESGVWKHGSTSMESTA